MSTSPNKKSTGKQLRAERHSVAIPMSLGPTSGVVTDISATGVYFEIDQKQELGSEINFTLDLDTPGGMIQVQCRAKIVRLEEKSGRIGIGAIVHDTSFKSSASD